MNQATLTAAVEAFDDWARPWTFFEAVSTGATLSIADRELLEAIWKEASREIHWRGELPQGCGMAGRALAVRYPWISTAARRQVVRAASYLWR